MGAFIYPGAFHPFICGIQRLNWVHAPFGGRPSRVSHVFPVLVFVVGAHPSITLSPLLSDSSCFLFGHPSQVCSTSPTRFLAWRPQLVRLLGNFPLHVLKARRISNLYLVCSPWFTQGIQVTHLFVWQVCSVEHFHNRCVRSSKILSLVRAPMSTKGTHFPTSSVKSLHLNFFASHVMVKSSLARQHA
jgi:hypothetical protein